MSDSTGIVSATDAVRYLYLARVTERLGHPKAARRWREKADRWLETIGLRRQESDRQARSESGTRT